MLSSIVPIVDPEPPPPDPDPERCHLLGPTALVVQALMGVFVITSLVIKRQLEKRKRPWKIWTWDVGKQLVGQAVIHGLNLLISDVVAHAADDNPCSLYFLNVLIDTTIGVAIFYFALKGFTWYFASHLALDGYITGLYGSPPQPINWWKQLAPYLLSIITMKLLVVLPLTLPRVSTFLLRIAYKLLEYLSADIQVIFVLALFPLAMNVVQFCIIDQVIKAGKLPEDDEEGYTRIPTDVEGEAEHGTGPRRRRGSAPALEIADGIVAVPRSPLLSPAPSEGKARLRDYGSTSPSPRPSGEASDGFWARLSRSGGEGSELTVEDRDYHRRSGAPSPESARIAELASSPEESGGQYATMHASQLSDEVRREAAENLSPTTRSPRVPQGRGDEGMSMRDMP